jgi:hypothetical protein
VHVRPDLLSNSAASLAFRGQVWHLDERLASQQPKIGAPGPSQQALDSFFLSCYTVAQFDMQKL